jgi:lipoate-protein ligase A
MAVDEAILQSISDEGVVPTLRLYAWRPPCLSLGYTQPIGDVDFTRLKQLSWDLVRRPTGGRAILHTDELTYSVIGPQDEPRLAGGVLESYQVLAQALLEALHLLSIPAESKSPQNEPQKSNNLESTTEKGPVCFEIPSSYEIVASGKKILGSAQARRREGVLQHGSLPLFGDLTRIVQALAFSDEAQRDLAAARLRERATTVEEIMNRRLEWQAASQAFIQAFQQVLNLNLQPGDLTPKELIRAEQLIAEKYTNPDWNARM